MPAVPYFRSLFAGALAAAKRLPLGREFPSMAVIVGTLCPAVAQLDAPSFLPAPSAAVLAEARQTSRAGPVRSAGLNTVGLLLDRLGILAMKHWALTHRADAPHLAAELENTQVAELALALAEARPGYSSINNKMTSHAVRSSGSGFQASAFGLFTTNLLLWEAQEVLYHHDLSVLPERELRAYISFFSENNLQRNAYIQAADQAWWTLIDQGAL